MKSQLHPRFAPCRMDEDVVSARVHDTFVHVCGKQSVQLVNNGNDVHPPKLSLTRISAFDVAPVAGKGQPYWPMLGCADGKIQVLKDGDVYYSAQVEGAVTALVHNREGIETLPGNKHAGRQEVVYGTQTGVVAQMFLDEQAARRGWVIAGKGLKPAPVTQVSADGCGCLRCRCAMTEPGAALRGGHVCCM